MSIKISAIRDYGWSACLTLDMINIMSANF